VFRPTSPEELSPRPLLVGRARERSLTQTQLGAALAGRGSLVILSGEAGIGKTTLAEDVCREAAAAGALVLTGHCYDRSETPPYGPWVELLERAGTLTEGSSEPLSAVELSLTEGTSRAALFRALRGFFVDIARATPLVILLDDLQWADNASLDLLRFIARQIGSVSMLLLVTYRTDEVTRRHPLYRQLPLLIREALAVRIDLPPLTDDDVRTLIVHAYQLPAADAGRLAGYLQVRAEGNPFFLGELLRSLEGTALLRTAVGGWMLGPLERVGVPMLLRQVIDARLAGLGSEVDALLSIAAVIGQVVPLALWADLAETTEVALLPFVERAVEAHILSAAADGLSVRFVHALVREAVYESILSPRRRSWHRKIGEILAEQPKPDPDAVAFHLSQAADRRAAEWLTRAGERAQRAFAWPTATLRFEAALALLEEDDTGGNECGWLRFRLAMLRRFVDPAAGAAHMVEAERLGRMTADAALVAYAHFFLGMLRRMTGDFEQGNVISEEGVALLDALSSVDHARLAALNTTSDPLDPQNGRGELTLMLGEAGRYAEAQSIGERIVHLPPSETFGSRGDAYYGLGYTYAALGQPTFARRAFAEARAGFRSVDHRTQVLATLFDELVLVVLPYQIDQPGEREQVEAELGEAFTTLEGMFDPNSSEVATAVSRVLTGAWSGAFAVFEQRSFSFLRFLDANLLAPIARYQGNAELAWRLVRGGLPDGPETAPENSAGYIVPLRALAPMLALDAGDRDGARQWLIAFDRWLSWSGGVLGQADVHLGWAEYYRELGDNTRAQARAMQALVAAGTPRQPLALLAAHRLLGELDIAAGRLTAAEEQLGAALSLADACGARHEQALTRLAFAELCNARGDVPTVRSHLDAVRSLCTPMGAALTLDRADRLATRLDALRAGRSTALPAGLTPREGEVLRLLTRGLTNAEIADHLSLSPRTINAHLTTIYSKLGVSSRGGAIRFALDHDLR